MSEAYRTQLTVTEQQQQQKWEWQPLEFISKENFLN